ncbi:MAG: alpha/beta hydrolase [bacterium]
MKRIAQQSLRIVRQILFAAVFAILFWTTLAMIFENKFIYFPSSYSQSEYVPAATVPGLQDCWFTAEDGIKLHGWYLPADSPRATLIISHGNAGNIAHRLILLKGYQRAGFNVMMYDYRGYGRSEGSPSEEGIYADGRAAYDHTLMLKGVDSNKIILWGTSLGGAVAVDVALHRKAAGLILESAFSSARDVAKAAYPFLPVYLTLHTKLNSIDKIPQVHVPLLAMHGNHDSVIPFSLGRKLYASANEPKEFYIIEGADHNDTYFIGGNEYLQKVQAFATRLGASVSR